MKEYNENNDDKFGTKRLIVLESQKILDQIDELLDDVLADKIDYYDVDFKQAILFDVNKKISNRIFNRSVKLVH
jgi:hypothetical protein